MTWILASHWWLGPSARAAIIFCKLRSGSWTLTGLGDRDCTSAYKHKQYDRVYSKYFFCGNTPGKYRCSGFSIFSVTQAMKGLSFRSRPSPVQRKYFSMLWMEKTQSFNLRDPPSTFPPNSLNNRHSFINLRALKLTPRLKHGEDIPIWIKPRYKKGQSSDRGGQRGRIFWKQCKRIEVFS